MRVRTKCLRRLDELRPDKFIAKENGSSLASSPSEVQAACKFLAAWKVPGVELFLSSRWDRLVPHVPWLQLTLWDRLWEKTPNLLIYCHSRTIQASSFLSMSLLRHWSRRSECSGSPRVEVQNTSRGQALAAEPSAHFSAPSSYAYQ